MSPEAGPSGAQKVAAFLLSLDRSAAAAVMKRLDAGVVAEVAAAMGSLDASFAAPEAVERLYHDLARTLNKKRGPSAARETELAAMLEAAFGAERSQKVVAEIRDRNRQERPFAFLEQQPPDVVQRVLAGEAPSVVALVLAHVTPELAGEVLGGFEPEPALDVVRRMASITPPGFRVLARVADELQERLARVLAEPAPVEPAQRQKTIAEMLKFSDPDIEKVVLERLEGEDEGMAAEIREHMFTWIDLAGVDKRAMQKILASVDTRTLAIALKGCQADVEANIMSNLSARVRDMVADERELAGPTPMIEVQAARAEMLRGVRALMEGGEFRPSRAGEELVD
jgi:flagellar motor switch protein FliG